MRTFAKIIVYGFVLLLIAAVIGFVYKFTNGFNEDLKTFYVEYGSKQILSTENKMIFTMGDKHRFNVKYTFDKEDAEPKDYKVKIVPHMTRDFDYTVDGERYLFSKLGNLTDVFNIEKSDTYFELYLPDSLTFSEVLKKAQGGKSISIPADALTNNPYPFRLQISSYNEKVTYNIDFTFGSLSESSSTGTGQTSSGNTSTTPPQEQETRKYYIGYLISGDGTNLVDIDIDSPTSAVSGEKVEFTVSISDSHYEIVDFYMYCFGVDYTPKIFHINGVYSFTMPPCSVEIRIDLKYHADEPDVPLYRIEYDTLGNGSHMSVKVDCVPMAAAGSTVTFTLTLVDLSDEFDDYYPLEITGVKIQYWESDYEYYLDGEGEGTYSFIMPENDVTILIYMLRA